MEGKNIFLHGRRCRTERSKTNREPEISWMTPTLADLVSGFFVLSRSDGAPLLAEEAYQIVLPFGDPSYVAPASEQDCNAANVPAGVRVEFSEFDSKRDAALVSLRRSLRRRPCRGRDPSHFEIAGLADIFLARLDS